MELTITEQSFSKIRALTKLPKLEYFELGGSKFRQFPDLTNVGSSLVEFRLTFSKVKLVSHVNDITHMQHIFRGTI